MENRLNKDYLPEKWRILRSGLAIPTVTIENAPQDSIADEAKLMIKPVWRATQGSRYVIDSEPPENVLDALIKFTALNKAHLLNAYRWDEDTILNSEITQLNSEDPKDEYLWNKTHIWPDDITKVYKGWYIEDSVFGNQVEDPFAEALRGQSRFNRTPEELETLFIPKIEQYLHDLGINFTKVRLRSVPDVYAVRKSENQLRLRESEPTWGDGKYFEFLANRLLGDRRRLIAGGITGPFVRYFAHPTNFDPFLSDDFEERDTDTYRNPNVGAGFTIVFRD